MSGSRASSNETEKAGTEVPAEEPVTDDSDEDESEILEESPCGRWVKRREEVRSKNLISHLINTTT